MNIMELYIFLFLLIAGFLLIIWVICAGVFFIYKEIKRRNEIKEIRNNSNLPRSLADRRIEAVCKKHDDQLRVLNLPKRLFKILKFWK